MSSSQSKITEFEATYTRVVLIHKVHQTVLFATPGLAEFCGASCRFLPVTPILIQALINTGVPHAAMDDLVGTEFCKMVAGTTKDVTSRLRRNVKTALEHGHSYSLAIGLQIKPSAKNNLLLVPPPLWTAAPSD